MINSNRLKLDVIKRGLERIYFKKIRLFLISSCLFLLTITGYSQITLQGSATSATSINSTTLTITKPSGVVSGDLLLVNISKVGNDTEDPTLDGWTLIAGADLGGGTARRGSVLYRIADGTEGSDFTFNLGTGTSSAVGAMVAFSGVDGNNPFDATGTLTVRNAANLQTAAISTATDGTAIIMFGMVGNTSATFSNWTTTVPGVLTELYDVNNGTNVAVGAAWAIKNAAGSTGNGTATVVNSRNGSILIALKSSVSASSTFTTAGSYTVTIPNCASSVTINAWGAGGGGSNRNGASGGGGGGAYTRGTISGLTPGGTLTVTVGAGGTAGLPTTAPGNYSRITYGSNTITANGGLSVNNSRNGGAGGTAQTVGGIIISAFAGGAGGNANSYTNGNNNEAGGGGGGSAFTTANGNDGNDGGSSTTAVTTGGTGTGNGGNGAAADGNPGATAGSAPGGGGGGRGEGNSTSQPGADGQVILEWTFSSPPYFTSHPSTTAQNLCQNEVADELSVSASGFGLTYQWYSNTVNSNSGGTLITGATSTSYTPSTSVAGTLYYYVIVSSSGCTSVASNVSGAVTVSPGPELITSPGSQCKYGETVDVTVSASSSSTGTFRWYNSSYSLLKTESSVSESSYDVYGISTTTPFYVTLESGGCTTPYTEVNAYAIIPPSLSASAGGSFCVGSTIYLYSEGTYDNIYWEGPNDFYSIEEDPTISSATTDMNGTYSVHTNTLSHVNLVVNGDFEDGRVGFESDYLFHDTTEVLPACYASAPLGCEGTYTVVKSPRSVHPNFYLCGDHTSGRGYQMVINGALEPDEVIWRQTVNVVPNTYYQFSYWVQSVELSYVSQLQLFVNSELAGPVYTASESTCEWTQFFYSWNSGDNTSAILELVNQRTGTAGGNDFALDDIVFQHTCTASASVEVNVSTSFTPAVSIAASPATTACSGGEVIFTATPAHGGATPSYQWRLNSNPVGTNSPDYTNSSLATSDQIYCVMTSSLTSCLAPGSNPATSNTLTMTINPLPTIVLPTGTLVSVRNRTTSQTTSLDYTSTTQSPVYYSIDWDNTANLAGLTDQSGESFSFSTTGGTIDNIVIPANVPQGSYSGVLTVENANVCISATHSVTIVILPATIFTGQPDDLTLCAGTSGSTSVTVDATSPTYQWQYFNGTVWTDIDATFLSGTVSGFTGNILSVTTAPNSSVSYSIRCEVTDGAYTENSEEALLTLYAEPGITLQSPTTSVCTGATVAYLNYTSTAANPNRYSLNYDATAESQGFTDVSNAMLSGSSGTLNLAVPAGADPGTYSAALTVSNTTTGCTGAEIPISVLVLYPQVDLTAEVSNPKCPDMEQALDFDPNTAGPYDAGASEIIFKVSRISPANQTWYFNYSLSVTGSTLDTDFTQPEANPTDPVVKNSSDSDHELIFYVVNQPGQSITVELSISNVSVGGCVDSSNGTHTSSVVISVMPQIGNFN